MLNLNYYKPKILIPVIYTNPNLNGTYIGRISYYYESENQEKDCKLTITQTCSNIRVSCIFNEAEEPTTTSVSHVAFIETNKQGIQTLYFYYSNRGSGKNGDSLAPHDGFNVLEIKESKEKIKLEGYYFTNRKPQQTQGNMVMVKLKGDIHNEDT